jgi:hypothetical protein
VTRFAPDGQTVLYSAAWEGRPSEIFSTHLSALGSRPLGISPSWLSGWISTAGHVSCFESLPSPPSKTYRRTGAYAYSYERVLSELYLVEGLK